MTGIRRGKAHRQDRPDRRGQPFGKIFWCPCLRSPDSRDIFRLFQPAASDGRADGADRRRDPCRCRSGKNIEQTPGDETCEHTTYGRHAEGKALPLGGVVVGDDERDIGHDRGRVQRIGQYLKRLRGKEQRDVRRRGDRGGLEREEDKRKPQHSGAAPPTENAREEQHRRHLERGEERGEIAERLGTAAGVLHKVDEKRGRGVVREKEERHSGEQQTEAGILPQKYAERTALRRRCGMAGEQLPAQPEGERGCGGDPGGK